MAKKSSYYNGALRFSRDGIPCKVASWVANLSDRSRAEMLGGCDVRSSAKQREAGAMVRYSQTTYSVKESFSIAAE